MATGTLAERVGELIRTHREAARLTQRQLSVLMGCGVMVISCWERGVTTPTLRNLLVAAPHIHLDLGDLNTLIAELDNGDGEAAA